MNAGLSAEEVARIRQLTRLDRDGLRPARWSDLPGWRDDALESALIAFLRSCTVLASEPRWEDACVVGFALPSGAPSRRVRAFFERYFRPWQVMNADGSSTGRITGYYEPLLHGSRQRSQRYRYPLYARPDDVLQIDLAGSFPEFRGRGLRGRMEGGRVVPYFSRAEIEDPNSPFRGRVLVWVDNPVDALFLHIQGSGQVQLDTGDVMRVGFADHNGHPFRSVATYLKARGELEAGQLSMRGIKAWADRNPDRVQEFLNFNPRYIFFRELPRSLQGPLGTLGVPLTAERSIAIDPSFVPLGAPVFLSAEAAAPRGWSRLMMAQDTGGVIRGGVRADVFWGFGESALRRASRTNQRARMWVLLPQ